MQFAGVLPPDAPDPRAESEARLAQIEFTLFELCPQPALERLLGASTMTDSRSTMSSVAFSYTLWRHPEDRADPRNLVELDERTQRSLDEEPPWPRPPWLVEAAELFRYPMLWEAIRTTWHSDPTRPGAALSHQLVDHTNHVLRNRFGEELGLPAVPPPPDRDEGWGATESAVTPSSLTVDGEQREALQIDTDPFVYSVGFPVSDDTVCTIVVPRDDLPFVDLSACRFTPAPAPARTT